MAYPNAPTSLDLLFGEARQALGAPVELVFGADAVVSPPPPPPPPPVVTRFAVVSRTHARHQPGAGRARHTHAAWRPGRHQPKATPVTWQPAHPAHVAQRSTWSPSQELRAGGLVAWAGAAVVAVQVGSQWQVPTAHLSRSRSAWAEALPVVPAATGVRFGLGKPTPKVQVAPWSVGRGLPVHVASGFAPLAKAQHRAKAAPWQGARTLASRGGPRYLPLPRPVEPVRAPTIADLVLCREYPSSSGHPALGLLLVFGGPACPGQPLAPIYILPARFYMAVHQIEAHLLPSLEPIPIFDVSLSADSGSFAWTFSASGPASLFDDLAPAGGLPPSIRITLDGMQWVFVVDSLQRQEQFGKRSTRLAGRSATALVGSPYSRESARLNATARNAQQLAAAALDLTGIDLDWGIEDWLVPAGAWSHTGTPLAAVQAIAEAAGGYVNSHRSDPTLLVRHPYPTLPGGVPGGPWNWGSVAAADVELAASAIITSSIDRRDGPDVDGIYVSGTAQGVLAHVKRTGTAGAKLASMVADPLITANIAAQQRGLSVLGAAGAKHLVQISLPVLTGGSNPGVLDVGQLVQVNDTTPWRGMVRSVGVQASQPKVRQTVTLERHLT